MDGDFSRSGLWKKTIIEKKRLEEGIR
jgi:hypothetical protein